MRTVAQALAGQAQCQMLLGQADKALESVTAIHDLTRLLQARPITTVEAMMHSAIAGLYAETVEEGLRMGAWGEPELAALQEQLQSVNLLEPVATSLQTERAFTCDKIEHITHADFARNPYSIGLPLTPKTSRWLEMAPDWLRKVWTLSPQAKARLDRGFFNMIPRGWLYQNMTRAARLNQGAVAMTDPARGLVYPAIARDYDREMDAALASWSPYTCVVRPFLIGWTRGIKTTAYNQTMINQALVVCGLERYRLAHGQYPETIDALVPRYLAKPPHDLIGGQPLKYRRMAEGEFILYSIGWNEKDDGGVPGKGWAAEDGDWVWGSQW